MEYCTLKGFLVVLLIQHCRSEGLSTSIHSSTAVSHQDGQSVAQESALPPAEVAPVVSPPSLEEVQQAVQEASEQVEGRGAEEVLKELLERVVEAALGQVEGGSEAKGDAATVQEAVEEDALGAETSEGEADTEAEVLEQTVEDENMGAKGGDARVVEETQEVQEAAALEDVGEEEKGVVQGEDAVESLDETTAEVEPGEVEAVEVADESPGPEASQNAVDVAGSILEETGGDLEVEEAAEEPIQIPEEEDETGIEEEETAVVEVAAGEQQEQKPVQESDPDLGEDDVEQKEQDLGEEDVPGGITQGEEETSEITAQSFVTSEFEGTQTVVGEAVEQEHEENVVKDMEIPVVENEEVALVEGGATEEVESEVAGKEEATGDETNGESFIEEDSVGLANEEGGQRAGEEEQIVLETQDGFEKDDKEELLISGPEPEDSAEASIEQSPESQTPSPNPSIGEVETGENDLDDATSDNVDKFLAPTDGLAHDPDAVQPSLDNSVNDALAEEPQAEGEEPGEANELVEDTPETSEANLPGLEAWKIGAISAAVFLVLETIVIIIYILKCRNKNSSSGLQRACEEGCVEPEAATGGDCSDDTLPASNGDTQQISMLDASDVASTLAKTKEQQEDHAIAMSELPPSSTEESANAGLGPDPSQDLRTSIL